MVYRQWYLRGVFQAVVSTRGVQNIFVNPNRSAAEAVAGKDFDDRSTVGLTRRQSASLFLILAST